MSEEERARVEAETIEQLIAEREAARAEAIAAGKDPDSVADSRKSQAADSQPSGKAEPWWAFWRRG